MANFKKNDEAVSAVIGVILMVAITVILAAVIAAFVFQLGGSTPKSKTVGLDVKRINSTAFSVKTMNGADIALLCNTSAQPSYTATCTNPDGASVALGYNTYDAKDIGDTVIFAASSTIASGADITIIGHFTDGTETALRSGPLP